MSDAATLTIRIARSTGFTDAEIFLTGGEVTSAVLSGSAHKTGENIWTVELNCKKPKLSVRDIFRGNTFVGDLHLDPPISHARSGAMDVEKRVSVSRKGVAL